MDLATTAPTSTLRRVVALTGAVAFAVLTIYMWHSTRPMRWERPIIRVAGWMPLPSRDFWIAAFQPVPFALTTVALGAVAAARGRHRLALTGIAGCLGAVVAAQVVFKPLVDRVRTHVEGDDHHIVRVGSRLFPSTHVTAAAAWAMFAVLIFGRRTRLASLAFALPVVVGCAVLSRELHYPADVVGGFLLGTTFVYFTVDAACTVEQAFARRRSQLGQRELAHAVSAGGAGRSSPPTTHPPGPYRPSPRGRDR
ncbi:MAG TPA: phosphatase PAP2 family protein [Acidimicrobiia bacterium]